MDSFEKRTRIQIYLKGISYLETKNIFSNFMYKIKVFEQNYLKLENHKNFINSRYYFMLKEGKLTIMCSDNKINEKNSESLKMDLMNFIEANKINHIEYALFPVSFAPRSRTNPLLPPTLR